MDIIILRPGTQYRVNTRIRDGEVNLDNSTVEEETYGSVRDRIAGFNKELNINGCQLENPDISGAIFTLSLSILILNSQ